MSAGGAAGADGAVGTGPRVVQAEALRRFTRAVFETKGYAPDHAAIVADVLVWANLRGIDTHGVVRVPRYVEYLDEGGVIARPLITLRNETAAAVVVDAGRAAGPIAMSVGAEQAVRKAREAGLGMALVCATSHAGALGYFTLKIVEQGMAAIGIAGSWPNMVYHGTRKASVSTSPISFATPGGAHGPVVLDMATGVISMGKLVQARRLGQPLPPGSAIDKQGNLTTDAKAADAPMPLGGPKGSGLALMIELLCSVLSGHPILAEFIEGAPGSERQKQNGMFIAIDIARFCDPAYFAQQVERLVRDLKALPKDPDVPEILMPGERGARTLAKRMRDGIPIPPHVGKELDALAARLALPALA